MQREPNSVSAAGLRGATLHRGFLDRKRQAGMARDIAAAAAAAPPVSPLTPRGRPMSVRMTSAGKYGWFTDRKGYRYIDRQPSGAPWPPIPDSVLDVWREAGDATRMPDCCLINFYSGKARMGLHQDRDEADFRWPVVSISLGDDALFRIGGTSRSDPTESLWLRSGDVLVLGGDARLAYHGIDRIAAGTSDLVPGGGRINLTLRVVD